MTPPRLWATFPGDPCAAHRYTRHNDAAHRVHQRSITNLKEKGGKDMTHEVWQIRVQGHLGSQWKDWFEGMTITNDEKGDAILSGPLADQAALYGVLLK